MRSIYKYILTAVIVGIAVIAVAIHYIDYLRNPWTRDGQVRADVIQVAPRVSGPIVSLPIHDNQRVKAGDILFEIDPRTYRAALDAAQADYDQTVNDVEVLQLQVLAAQEGVAQAQSAITQASSQLTAAASTLREAASELRRNSALVERGDVSQAKLDQVQRDYDVDRANRDQAAVEVAKARSASAQANAMLAEARANLGGEGANNERIRAAAANLETARLNLEFATVRASRDGYVTNLRLRIGSQAVANQPMLALIDESSFWIDAYFRETLIKHMRPGDGAVITMMGYGDMPFRGTVESIGWGIAKQDGSDGVDLLPNVAPTFQWIRLAQRIPVRIQLGELPEGIELRVGQTASILVHSGKAKGVAAPTILQ